MGKKKVICYGGIGINWKVDLHSAQLRQDQQSGGTGGLQISRGFPASCCDALDEALHSASLQGLVKLLKFVKWGKEHYLYTGFWHVSKYGANRVVPFSIDPWACLPHIPKASFRTRSHVWVVGVFYLRHYGTSFGFSIDLVSSNWADKHIGQCSLQVLAISGLWKPNKIVLSKTHVSLGNKIFQILLLKVEYFFFFQKRKEICV